MNQKLDFYIGFTTVLIVPAGVQQEIFHFEDALVEFYLYMVPLLQLLMVALEHLLSYWLMVIQLLLLAVVATLNFILCVVGLQEALLCR